MVEESKRGQIHGDERRTLDEHIMQYMDNVLQNCTLETYVVLLTIVTPTNKIKRKNKVFRDSKPYFTILPLLLISS